MRNILCAASALPFLVGLALSAVRSDTAVAAETHSFVVSANDGYGIEDCLAERSECGHAVADAWCEAHGHSGAVSFGAAEDVTGSIGPAAPRTDRPYIVTCSD